MTAALVADVATFVGLAAVAGMVATVIVLKWKGDA